MIKLMAVVNLTPDSFWTPSRVEASGITDRINELVSKGADIIDIGAVSTRPGAAAVSVEDEWARLEPALKLITSSFSLDKRPVISIDTTSSEIVRRCYEVLGSFIVNDISAGEDDPEMLPLVGRLKLSYVAMHKRGNPRTMDSLADYPDGVVAELLKYFEAFSAKASDNGIEDWILDPGLGFAKTPEQCWEVLERLSELRVFGRPILIGAADKRFVGGEARRAEELAIKGGASILRVHL